MDQVGCDALLRELDGTPALSRLGANAVLGTSLAVCRASAHVAGQPLHRRIADLAGVTDATLPLPMVNILSGGLHARHGMDIQDLLAIPIAATTMLDAIYIVSRVREAATVLCAERDIPTLLADEGGLSPGCRTGRQALELMIAAIERAGLDPVGTSASPSTSPPPRSTTRTRGRTAWPARGARQHAGDDRHDRLVGG